MMVTLLLWVFGPFIVPLGYAVWQYRRGREE